MLIFHDFGPDGVEVVDMNDTVTFYNKFIFKGKTYRVINEMMFESSKRDTLKGKKDIFVIVGYYLDDDCHIDDQFWKSIFEKTKKIIKDCGYKYLGIVYDVFKSMVT